LKIEGNENVLSYLPDQKLVGGQVAVHPSQQLDAAGVTARLELVPANSTLFLGEVTTTWLKCLNVMPARCTSLSTLSGLVKGSIPTIRGVNAVC
jgi:hypothetical protein